MNRAGKKRTKCAIQAAWWRFYALENISRSEMLVFLYQHIAKSSNKTRKHASV